MGMRTIAKHNRVQSWYGKIGVINALLRCAWFSLIILVVNTQSIYAAPLVLAAAADSVPTSYMKDGIQAGILVDVINEVFRRAGYTVEIKLMPWARCLEDARNGEVDGVFSVFDLPERREFLTYAPEVLIVQEVVFFVLADSRITFDGDLKKISNSTIGIINKTSYGSRMDLKLRDGTFAKIDRTNSSESNIKKLLAGRVDIIPSYRDVVLSTTKKMGMKNRIKELSPAIESTPSYLAFTKRRDYQEVIEAYNAALLSMKKDGTYTRIFNKYLQ